MWESDREREFCIVAGHGGDVLHVLVLEGAADTFVWDVRDPWGRQLPSACLEARIRRQSPAYDRNDS